MVILKKYIYDNILSIFINFLRVSYEKFYFKYQTYDQTYYCLIFIYFYWNVFKKFISPEKQKKNGKPMFFESIENYFLIKNV